MKLQKNNGFRIHPTRWALSALVGAFTAGNSVLHRLQNFRCLKRIEQQPIDPAPLFVVGHWRSGTTLLHELLALDENFAFPSTVECFAPNHFLVSEPLLKPLLRRLLPARRPMDNMQTGVDLPQEDEFALIGLGAPTPYLRMAFPNENRPFDCLLDMKEMPEKVEQDFEKGLTYFLKALMLKKQKQLILKSPTHTGRIAWLAHKYPGSRFVHISRNPLEVFLSTKRLWQRLDLVQGFQIPKYSDQQLEDLVMDNYDRMYGGYFDGRAQIPSDQLIEIQFETLMQDPVGVMEGVYQQLNLGDYTEVGRRIGENMEKRGGYKAASYSVDPEVEKRVMSRWSKYAEAFGYQSAEIT